MASRVTEIPLPDPRQARWLDAFVASRGQWLLALTVLIVLAYVPTGVTLNAGAWQTEQDGHGPFILGIAAWIVWTKRADLMAADYVPAPLLGWPALAIGMIMLFVGRSQEILAIETFSILPVLTGVTLLVGGWRVFRILAFPIGMLVFATPPPGWALDVFTVPLKAWISDWVARLLYKLGYPIAQNGVVILIGPYQLLVKDACSGMNSIFALSAIGVVYLYLMEYRSRLRNLLLLLAILPVTIGANFIRVVLLVLIAYHLGMQAVDGPLHDMTGIILFAIAFFLIVLFDGVLGLMFGLGRKLRGSPPAPTDA